MSVDMTEDDKKNDDPNIIYRIYSVASYFVVLLIIGLPMWWLTTRVYRADLPLDQMFDVEIHSRPDKEFGLPLSLDYDVLITVVNPDPENIQFGLNMRKLDKALQPFLATVAPVANFTVKSQFLYLVELGVVPRKVDDHFAVSEEQLPHIITPLEKRLWSHMSPRPCINLVIFVARCGSPIHIYDKNNQIIPTNAFLSPRWGGILILNPDQSSCDSRKYEPTLTSIVPTFLKQLRKLLGVAGNEPDHIHKFKHAKAEDLIDSTKRTLKSLAQLLSEINSIVISDGVAQKIQVAVEAREQAERYMSEGDVEVGLERAKVAFANSEAAFSDPSLLALLYFPDDQKYAVYIPLFLPVMIPVFMSLTTVRKWYKSVQNAKLKSD